MLFLVGSIFVFVKQGWDISSRPSPEPESHEPPPETPPEPLLHPRKQVVDISSRPSAHIELNLKREMIGQLSCEMIPLVPPEIMNARCC